MDLTGDSGQEASKTTADGQHNLTSPMEPRRKDNMPDLLRVDASSVENGGDSHDHAAAVEGNRTPSPSPSGNAPENVTSEVKLLNGDRNHVESAAGEQKKKIPVESLSKEELIAQVKKQMILLQKTKARYDELQKKFTDSERPIIPNGTAEQNSSDDRSASLLREKITSLEADLKAERELHRKAKEQQQTPKTAQNSVADLELRDYQRTIALLNEKVTAKDDCILRITEQLRTADQLLLTKQQTVQDQAKQIEELAEKNARLESSLSDAHREHADKARLMSGLRDELSSAGEKIRSLEGKLGSHSEEQSDLVRNFSRLQESVEAKERVVQGKNAEISRLTVDLAHVRSQHDHVLRDFEDYKVRAQALLRQKDNVVESAQRQREVDDLVQRVAELDADLEGKERKIVELNEELKKEKWAADAAKRTFDTEKVHWERTILDGEVKIRSFGGLPRLLFQESAFQDQRRKIKAYEIEINSLKDLHGSTNEKLLDDLRQLRTENESLRHKDTSLDSRFDRMDLSLDELNFTRSKSEEFGPTDVARSRSGSSEHNSSPTSELPSSVFNRTISVSASEPNNSISQQPFEKLIAFPVHNSVATTSAKDIEVRRMAHLSELLHESESANVRLNDQIRLLKSELRRVEANTERDKHANSLEYLKNVLMQFLTHRVAASEQEKLIEVMTTILKLTTEERQQLLKAAASASYIPEGIKSWGTYLNPWKAKDDG
ncbi:putative GRIP and coiled-coil domain-containing protein 2 [Hypsibius exemplaris]|uniref:GRIP and coiled-coil domain-containing protein 2 n=1 Tax=Hypsibius exemplaris TaxID=2072580 RepID=A0A9X6RN01_HYPEX|nr:putative GRIP and coiled-coil domain-containing protein 2 [Hypsibius exemplaris]